MKILYCFLLTMLFSFQVSTQPLKLGDKIPQLTIQNLMKASKTSIDLQTLKGKVVVLDFWATWCIPCVQSFPKLEKMQKKFGSDLQIISISDETPERVSSFIKNRPYDLWFASDPNPASILKQTFPHFSLPHVVIIDKEGVVRAITNGKELTEDVIAQVQEGSTPNVSFKNEVLVKGEVLVRNSLSSKDFKKE